MKNLSKHYGVIFAIISAILFGISTPLAKELLSIINPWLKGAIIIAQTVAPRVGG